MNNIYQVNSVLGIAEPFSFFSHLIGAIAFLFLGYILLRSRTTPLVHTLILLLYSFACISLLLVSATYHFLPVDSSSRLILQHIDHAAINLMIAASFTAVQTLLFKGIWRWAMLTIIWIVAISGTIVKMIFFADIPEWIGLIFYLSFGWLGLISAFLLWKQYGYTFIKPLFYGGVVYTLGAVFEYFRQPVLIPDIMGPHELFHIAVLIGMGYHWLFIYRSLQINTA